jgi:hypothetical protein
MTTPVADVQELPVRVQQADQVFELYKSRPLGLVRSQLDTRIRRKADPEDVLQSVFRQRLEEGVLQPLSFFADAAH